MRAVVIFPSIEIDGDLLLRRLVLENQLMFGTVNAWPDAYEAAITDLPVLQFGDST